MVTKIVTPKDCMYIQYLKTIVKSINAARPGNTINKLRATVAGVEVSSVCPAEST